MRPIYTIVMIALLFGGTWAYVDFANRVRRPRTNVVYEKAAGITSVEVLRSFDAFGDPGFDVNAVEIRFNNKPVKTITETTLASDPLAIDQLDNVEQGVNEIVVLANAESPDAFLSNDPTASLRAMEVLVRYDGQQIAREMFTGRSGDALIGGTVLFEVPATSVPADNLTSNDE